MYDERDSRNTPDRDRICALYEERGIVPAIQGFRCCSLERCSEAGRRQLRTGNWAFIGAEYGKGTINGHPVRVTFVAMDRGGYGGADEEEFPDTQAAFRVSIEQPANPHMGGVALILKCLLDEQDPGKLSSQFALTNAVKCVQHTKSMSTKVTGNMIEECANHLRAELRTLIPDILITQGAHPRKTVLASIDRLQLIGEFAGNRRGRAAVFVKPGMVVLTTPHPARQAGLKWARGLLPEFYLSAIALARAETSRQLGMRALGNPSMP